MNKLGDNLYVRNEVLEKDSGIRLTSVVSSYSIGNRIYKDVYYLQTEKTYEVKTTIPELNIEVDRTIKVVETEDGVTIKITYNKRPQSKLPPLGELNLEII